MEIQQKPPRSWASQFSIFHDASSRTAPECLRRGPRGVQGRHYRTRLAAYFDPKVRKPKRRYYLRQMVNYQLLLTCHTVYKKVMPVYWSQTVVDIGGDRGRPGGGPMFDFIPPHARHYVQHIKMYHVQIGRFLWPRRTILRPDA